MGFTLDKNSHCAVIGHGSMATAIMKILNLNESSADWYVHNPEVHASLVSDGVNCRYLTDVEFDMRRIHLSNDINEVVSRSNVIFLVTPSAYLKNYLSQLDVPLTDKFIVSAIKGIVPDENVLISTYMKQHYGLCDEQLAFVSGPAHAEELSRNRLTYLTISSANIDNAKVIGEKFSASYIRLCFSEKMESLEFCSMMKNVYSVMVGVAIGMGYSDNFIAVLVANCAEELDRALAHFSKEKYEKIPSSFLGDLLVSSYSIHGRNRRLGVMIGRGNSVKSSLNEMTMVAEGYSISRYIHYLPAEKQAKLPIASLAYQILHNGLPARKAMKSLELILR